MKKLISLMFVLVLVLSLSSLVACGGGDEDEEVESSIPEAIETPTDTETPTTPATPTETSKPTATTSGGDLGDLEKYFKNRPDCVQFDMITTSAGQTEPTGSVWMKKTKMRYEMTIEQQETITLGDLDEGVMYTYMPDMGKWFKVEVTDEMKTLETDTILDCNPTTVGSDTIDGKSCTVIEYNCFGVESKEWIWKDKGVPLRDEYQSPEGTIVTEYKNYKFDCAPDTTFELPAGAQVTDMSEMMQGIEDMGNLNPEDFNQTPSPGSTGVPGGLPTNMPCSEFQMGSQEWIDCFSQFGADYMQE